ncbi:MAG: MFS transporter [Eubacteriales bacterium]|nr:MFS transporter [Eubacteriales bacterium]
MALLLLLIIYVAFIGLGIPDSLFGTAWPAIYTEFDLPVGMASCVTLLISGGTIVSCLLSARLIARFGTARITAVSTFLTAASLFGFSCSRNMLWLIGCAIPLGLGAGAIDTALNNYVALHYKAIHMNFLHCFYGVGVSVSPYLMSLALSDGSNWRGGYRTVFWIQFGISLLMFLSLPLWKKVGHSGGAQEEEEPIQAVGLLPLLRQPGIRAACLIFIGSCAIEYTCGVWGSTFLVNAKGFSASTAAMIITCYYVGYALGRFFSGLLSVRLGSWQIIRIGQCITIAAILILLLPLPSYIACLGLFLTGLGNGPVFPNILHLTPQNFGRDISQSAMGVQMSASYIGIMLAPALFGLLAQNISAGLFPWYLLVMFAVMIIGTRRIRRLPR